MKKILVIIAVLTFSILFIFLYQNIKSNYTNKFNEVNLLTQGAPLKIDWFNYFFAHNNFNLHEQIKTMIPDGFVEKQTVDNFVKNTYKDNFNNLENILLFVPLYNRETKKKESFILISAGIDGKLNSNYSRGDTIYDDEYLNKFEFYNLKEYSERKSMEFSIWRYLFGKKDYLVRYYNCIEDGDLMPQTIEYYNYQLHPPVPLNAISVIASFEKDTIIENKKIIILKSWMDDYKAFCTMHNPLKKEFTKGDTLMISGYLEKVDENFSFHLTHCTMSNNVTSYSVNEILKLSKLDKRQLRKREQMIGK